MFESSSVITLAPCRNAEIRWPKRSWTQKLRQTSLWLLLTVGYIYCIVCILACVLLVFVCVCQLTCTMIQMWKRQLVFARLWYYSQLQRGRLAASTTKVTSRRSNYSQKHCETWCCSTTGCFLCPCYSHLRVPLLHCSRIVLYWFSFHS